MTSPRTDPDVPYHRIPELPAELRGATVLKRMVDGLAFRYRRATDGLRPEDFKFKPGPESLSMSALMHHITQSTRPSFRDKSRAPRGGGRRGWPDVVAS